MAAPPARRVLGMRTRSFNKTGFDWLIEDSADKVLLHPIDDHATLAQQKFVAFENNIIVGPHAEIIWFFKFISIYEYSKSFHANSNHRIYIDCEYFFAFQLLSDVLILVGHFRRCQPINKVHTKIVTDSTVNITSISLRRRGCHFGGVFVTGGTEGFHHENRQCGRRHDLALGWRRLRLGEQPLSFG